jgi:hypothetical protein
MVTKGRGAELRFLLTNKIRNNRVQLLVANGIRRAVLACENGTSQVIARFRDFRNEEVVDIPWSCSLHSPSIRIWHITTDYLDNSTVGGTADYTTFDDGTTIIDTPLTYRENSWGSGETSTKFEESSNSTIFLAVMSVLLITTLFGAPSIVWHLYKTRAVTERHGGHTSMLPPEETESSAASYNEDSGSHLHFRYDEEEDTAAEPVQTEEANPDMGSTRGNVEVQDTTGSPGRPTRAEAEERSPTMPATMKNTGGGYICQELPIPLGMRMTGGAYMQPRTKEPDAAMLPGTSV